jgi:hypothetical protein
LFICRQRFNFIFESAKFKPHTLNPEEVRQLQQQLVAFSEVQAAYLVEKEVTLFPEERFCILGIVRKQGFIDTDQARLYRHRCRCPKTDSTADREARVSCTDLGARAQPRRVCASPETI